jgi:hypothetical protein
MTDLDYAPINARAARLDISASEAIRQLVHLGAWHDQAEAHGLVITDRARALLADGNAALLRFVRSDSGATIEAQMPAEAWDQLQAGAALLCAPEDMVSDE